jgi:hypothetical protein
VGMAQGAPHLILKIEAKEPIELGAFVGAFTSLGNEYERYIKQTNPDLSGEADMYVQEVRQGSIIVDMLPWISVAVPFIDDMEKVQIVEQFVRVWGGRFKSLFEKDSKLTPESRSELKDWADAVKAVATDPDANATLEAATFQDGKKEIRAAFKFSTPQARDAQRIIEARQRRLDAKEHADHTRVLMRFTRSDISDVIVGKPSARSN